MPARSIPRIVVGAVVGVLVVLTAQPSNATWSANSTGSVGGAAAVLAPATGEQVQADCVAVIGVRVTVEWEASTSPFTDGYEVLRSTHPAGPYLLIGSIADPLLEAFDDTALSLGTTYHYRVRATASDWTAWSGNTVSVSTPIICL